MTLQQAAEDLARMINCEVVPGDSPYEVTIQGQGYHVVFATFFGGWQATLHVPNTKSVTYFGEGVDVLALRLKAKLSGRDANF